MCPFWHLERSFSIFLYVSACLQWHLWRRQISIWYARTGPCTLHPLSSSEESILHPSKNQRNFLILSNTIKTWGSTSIPLPRNCATMSSARIRPLGVRITGRLPVPLGSLIGWAHEVCSLILASFGMETIWRKWPEVLQRMTQSLSLSLSSQGLLLLPRSWFFFFLTTLE